MTLNLQYYSSYPEDRQAAETALRQAAGVDDTRTAADIIAVQEGLQGENVLDPIGYDLIACSGLAGKAQKVREMVYEDQAALKVCPKQLWDRMLCNQLYLRRDSGWKCEGTGVEQISSENLELKGGGGRFTGPLAIRSVVWARVRRPGADGAVYVMCTHISGGRFEDQYFVQELADERRLQVERCVKVFKDFRRGEQDCAILVGDFNATAEYIAGGAMQGYYNLSIAASEGVNADAKAEGLRAQKLEERFKTYMVSPFTALRHERWAFAYNADLGVSSCFGHLVDHMATSRRDLVKGCRCEIKCLTNQKIGDKPPDTDLPLTDHNAIKVSFLI